MSIAIAELKVQLVGHNVFLPPLGNGDSNGDGSRFIFEPEMSAAIDGSFDEYDAQSLVEFAGRACYQSWQRPNPATATNRGYLSHILEVAHHSVLEHGNLSFYIEGVSRSLTHELVRHRHFSYSQLSQRYVDSSDVRFILPPAIRDAIRGDDFPIAGEMMEIKFIQSCERALADYKEMADTLFAMQEKLGVKDRKKALQTARSVLPNATETKLVLTANYRSLLEFFIKRDNPAADIEIQELAQAMLRIAALEAPNIFDPESRGLWDKSAAQSVTSHN